MSRFLSRCIQLCYVIYLNGIDQSNRDSRCYNRDSRLYERRMTRAELEPFLVLNLDARRF